MGIPEVSLEPVVGSGGCERPPSPPHRGKVSGKMGGAEVMVLCRVTTSESFSVKGRRE